MSPAKRAVKPANRPQPNSAQKKREVRRFRFQPAEILAVSILVSVASFFRFFALSEKLVFQGDQGRALLAARDILAGQLTVLGPETSVAGFHLGPFFYYLIAPALWLADYHPVGPAFLTAGMGVATVLLLYFYGKRFFSWEAGLLMGLLFALSPHAIWQSRMALEPAPVPFFAVLWLYAMTSWIEEKRWRWLVVSGLCIFLGIQLNFSFIALLPAALWLLIPELPLPGKIRYQLQRGSLVLLGIVAVLRTLWPPTTSWQYLLNIWTELTLPAFPVVAMLVPSVFLMFVGASLLKNPRPFPQTLWPLLALSLFSFSAFTLKNVSGEHALAMLFPVPAIAAGIAWKLFRPRTLRKEILALLSIIAVVLLLTVQAWRYLNQKEGQFLAEYQAVTEHILELAEGEPYRFVYRGHLDVYDAADDHYQYLLWQQGNAPVESFRREVSSETQDSWNRFHAAEYQRTIVLYQPPFNFNEYTGFQEAAEWNGRWFAVEEKTP